MLCQSCQQNKATLFVNIQHNSEKKRLHLCRTCYEKQNIKIPANFDLSSQFPFEEFMRGFTQQNPYQPKQPQLATKPYKQGNGFLDKFADNLTQRARDGLIDPVIGRDKEIERVVEILNRRKKNNPVLIGEPGVGKTAIVEGLALKIARGNVPAKLLNKEVYLLDVASLVANTGIRGQFEERMKQLMAELQRQKNIILFIDEIHMIVGAGAAEGSSMDAGNILKPALARGEFQVIGATTLKEYRNIEKDAALERRLQPVMVQEPTVQQAIEILKGIQKKYEQFHQVQYTNEAIEACVTLSHRYIQDRYLPDKAIDLLDEVGSKINLRTSPADENNVEDHLAQLVKEKEKAAKEENYELAARLRDKELELERRLEEDIVLRKAVVNVEDIQKIIEEKTGIPIGKLQTNEQMRLKNLEENLASKVVGQAEAVQKLARAIRRGRAGLKAKNRPIGSFLFVGPTGVGKTELTKTLAEELFGSKEAMIRLDMSEYMEKHSISKLIGSPPGYVGHEEAGQLTEKVRRNPYCIILLDEIEKAHPDVQHMFLQILEDGRLTDSQGRTVSFKNTVIIMTSNAGTTDKKITVGFGRENTATSVLDSLSSYFRPEFLNRLDAIIEFQSLEKEHMLQIVELMLKDLKETLKDEGIHVEFSKETLEKLADIGYHPAFGARPLRRAIQEHVEDKIADLLLDHQNVTKIDVTIANGDIVAKVAN